MNKLLNIECSSTLSSIKPLNESFDYGRLRIAYTGKNRNKSFISKESFERAIPTMFNCPVVAHYIREDDEIGSHDSELVKKDGEWDIVYVTEPVGLVPESAKWNWEEVCDDSGMHEYLVTDVYMWKRQEAYKKIKSNGVTKQSMEITVTEGEMVDDYYHIEDFYFTAFCLLGTAEPCFESASLMLFSDDQKAEWEEQYTQMVNDFKSAFASEQDNLKKEDETSFMNRELLEALLSQYEVAENDLPFEVEGLSDEELEAKFKESFADEPVDTPEDDPEPEPTPEGDTDNFNLESELRQTLHEAVSGAETIEMPWGMEPKYWMCDYDSTLNEVYFYDEENWTLYGATYEVSGDEVRVDFEGMKRKKFAIVDYVEGTFDNVAYSLERVGDITGKGVKSTSDEEYNTLNAAYQEAQARLEELEAFKAGINRAECADVFEEMESKYEAIEENEEYAAIKESFENDETATSAEELRNKIYAVVGKMMCNDSQSFSFKKVGVDDGFKNPVNKPYGNLFDGIVKE